MCKDSIGPCPSLCTDLPDLVPDLTMFQNSFYRQPELGRTLSYRYRYLDWVPVSRLQCEIEEGCIAPNATGVYRQLMRFAVLSYNFGLVPFRPFEPQADWEFHQCHNHYHSHETFAHYELLFPDGRTAAEGRKISFCLVDSFCINGVKTFTGCKEGEPQGISPCCGDLYSRNTPCQWIDVTDVTEGDYVIRVTISPNQEVPEMDFENNQISCNISLDGSRRTTLGACARRGIPANTPHTCACVRACVRTMCVYACIVHASVHAYNVCVCMHCVHVCVCVRTMCVYACVVCMCSSVFNVIFLVVLCTRVDKKHNY